MSTFDDIFAEQVDVQSFALSGEGFEYTPYNGVPRPITATICDQEVQFEKDPNRKRRMRWIEVLVDRDSVSGIDRPQPGDQLTQDSDERIPKVALMFQEVIQRDATAFILRFQESPRHTRAGNSSTSTQQ